MSNCIFCQIANKDLPSDIIYEDDEVIAFNDVNPQAPVHILVIPKKHIPSANHLDEENISVVNRIFLAIKEIVNEKGLRDDGYRIVNNCGKLGGQTVDHIHFHILSGRQLEWPPG